MNHLFIGRNAIKKHKNRFITEGPRIASLPPTAGENAELQSSMARRSFGRSKSFDHPAAIGYLSRVRSRRHSSRAQSVSQDMSMTRQMSVEEEIKEVPERLVQEKEPSLKTADLKDKLEEVPRNTDENTEQTSANSNLDSLKSAEFKTELSQTELTDINQNTPKETFFSTSSSSSSPQHDCQKPTKVDETPLDNLQEEGLDSKLLTCSLSETQDTQQQSHLVSDVVLPQAIILNNNNGQNNDVFLSEKPTLSENEDEESVFHLDSPETTTKDLDCPSGKEDSCAVASSHSVSNAAFSACAAPALVGHNQTPSPKHDPNSSFSDSDTNALSFDVSGLASANFSCETVSPMAECRDAAFIPLGTCLLNSISIENNCSNPDSPAMSDEASSLASFFETNSESLKISGDDEKTPQSVSPLPSEQCWDTGSTSSPLLNTTNNRRPRSHSYCSRDTLSPTEKIGIEFNVARINGNTLCNPNMECVGRMRRHSTKSEHCQKDPTTSDSLESLSSNTSEGNICNKVSIPKLTVRQSVSPSQAYLNQHCVINGMKLGLYKPSLLKTVNKKQKPSLQSMFSKS